jgi:hypothetical protein
MLSKNDPDRTTASKWEKWNMIMLHALGVAGVSPLKQNPTHLARIDQIPAILLPMI